MNVQEAYEGGGMLRVYAPGVERMRRDECSGRRRTRRCHRYFGGQICFILETNFREVLGIVTALADGLEADVQIGRAGDFNLFVGVRI
jgi:hypothetical protein